eukprot:scaffold11693_cov115-Isochrysis_galbana.AAC.7
MSDSTALMYPWSFSYFKKVANKSYEDNTFALGTVQTVRTHIPPPSSLGSGWGGAAPVRPSTGWTHLTAIFEHPAPLPPMVVGGGLLATVRALAPSHRRPAYHLRLSRLS